jgi:DNA (cytosine-5)-methyltransferase 1
MARQKKTYFLDLFSGIGGFALAAYNTGLRFDEHYFSEIDNYAVSIYQKRFPNAIPLGDIRGLDYEKLPKGEWLVTGGFPCQPHSTIRHDRKGKDDERNLWPICKDVMRKIRPRIALFENVPGLLSSNGGYFFNEVLSDISEIGYDSEWQIISAKEVGAPHLRKRVWIVAYSFGFRCKKNVFQNKHSQEKLSQMYQKAFNDNFTGIICSENRELPIEYFLRDSDGLSEELDRYKCLGNAIVPQCAEKIMRLSAFDLWRVR